jgi:hypothetical protein
VLNSASSKDPYHYVHLVLYTEERVCDVALIKYTLGSGETQEGLGIWRGGYKGAMGDKGS